MTQKCSKCGKPLEKERVKMVKLARCLRCQHKRSMERAMINNAKRRLRNYNKYYEKRTKKEGK